ncbi:MAG: hypothetical protein U1F43_34175 [Myxococcota bacterium]
MEFSDAMFACLADSTRRASIFSDTVLADVAAAAYEADRMPLQGPYTAVFDNVALTPHLAPRAAGEVRWSQGDGSLRGDGSVRIDGLGDDGLRASALWRGAIIARANPAASRIETAEVAWPDLGALDAAVTARLGSLPLDADTLERERRAEVLTRIRATLTRPDAMDAARLDGLLRHAGTRSIAELLAPSSRRPATLRLTFSDPGGPALASPIALPLAAAIFIRDAQARDFSLEALLALTKRAQARFEESGAEAPAAAALPRRQPIAAIWVVPAAWFDDAHWGSNDRTTNLRAAARWLAAEGIAFAPMAWPPTRTPP